jgi:hypothetical protein
MTTKKQEDKYLFFEKDLFRIKYYMTSFKTHINNDKLAKEVMSNPTRIVNAPYHTNFEDFNLMLNVDSEASKLINLINDDIAAPWNLKVDGYWAHVHLPLESTERHNHNSTMREDAVSFVYYVKTPERCGDLVFVLGDILPPAIIKPTEGTLVLFPSYLDHKVTKNLSKDVRISISGNLL